MQKIGGICLNWKVIAALAAVGVAIWTVAPNLVAAALPFLLLAACPISMIFMMRGMHGTQGAQQGSHGGHCAPQPEPASQAPRAEPTRAEQLAELKAQLAGMETQLSSIQAQTVALVSQIAELEAPSAPAVREAEEVARAAEERPQASS